MPIYRGEMFYVFPRECTGSEQQSGRPAIVVSNDINNAKSSVVEVVYLTAQEKNYIPTHVGIKSAPRESIALCEQIHSVSIDRLGDYVGRVTQQEMQMIDVALLVSLQLDEYTPSEGVHQGGTSELQKELATMIAKYETIKELYDSLLQSLLHLA
jgi:mRNA interferase MazF